MPHIKTEMPERFRRLIQSAMEKQDLSMRQLALQAGLSPSFLCRILAGERGVPSEKSIRNVATALQIDPEQLLIAAGRTPTKLKAALEKPLMPELLRAAGTLSEEDRKVVLQSVQALILKHSRKSA